MTGTEDAQPKIVNTFRPKHFFYSNVPQYPEGVDSGEKT